jgi:hypothetical protein
MVICNTPDEELRGNIRVNTAKDLRWLAAVPEHDKPAIMVGGGPSVADYVPQIRGLHDMGGTTFAMNAASQWLRKNNIPADYQCILDAKEETSLLLDPEAQQQIVASQVHPATMDAATDPLVWHLEIGEMEELFPPEKVAQGGYCLLAGGSSVGNSAMAVAYALGYRTFHVFGYDCSHREGHSHAYTQSLNELMPTTTMEWGGKSYLLSMSMRGQLTAFQVMAGELKRNGCEIEMYGDGLLQAVYRTKPEDLTEKAKYQAMWNFDDYREFSPGEACVQQFLEVAKPDGLILDLGCGTGRASVVMTQAGYKTFLVDFADNCRDQEALDLPFLEWDLTETLPMHTPYGFCTDVMEHIPPEEVNVVLENIMRTCDRVFFQISTSQDSFGALIGTPLHLSVRGHGAWKDALEQFGTVEWEQEGQISAASQFYVKSKF